MQHRPRKPSRYSSSVPFAIASLVFTLCVLFPGACRAELLAYEGFVYDAPSVLAGQGGAQNGFTGPWAETGEGLSPDIVVEPEALEPVNFGNLQISGNVLRSHHSLDGATELRREFETFSGEVGSFLYASILVRRRSGSDTSGAHQFIFGLGSTTSGQPNIEMGDFANTIDYRLSHQGSVETIPSNVNALTNRTELLVMKISFLGDHSTPELVQLFVNPTPGLPEPALAQASKNDISLWNLNRMDIFLTGGPTREWFVDEIRLGTTFEDVTPTPEPGTLSLFVFGTLLAGTRRLRKACS